IFAPFAGLTEIVPAALGEAVVVHGALALAKRRVDGERLGRGSRGSTMLPNLIAFLVAVGASPPGVVVGLAQLKACIRQLDDDDCRTRERAAASLRRIGSPAVDSLKQTVATAKSSEVRERAEKLAREIRLASFPPGKTMAGIRATLRCERDVYRADEMIVM